MPSKRHSTEEKRDFELYASAAARGFEKLSKDEAAAVRRVDKERFLDFTRTMQKGIATELSGVSDKRFKAVRERFNLPWPSGREQRTNFAELFGAMVLALENAPDARTEEDEEVAELRRANLAFQLQEKKQRLTEQQLRFRLHAEKHIPVEACERWLGLWAKWGGSAVREACKHLLDRHGSEASDRFHDLFSAFMERFEAASVQLIESGELPAEAETLVSQAPREDANHATEDHDR